MTMLDRMRRHKGWLKWSLALVCLAFIVFYIPAFLDQGGAARSTDVVASVEGYDITVADFRRAYQAQLAAYRGAYGSNISEQMLRQLGIDQQILQQMVDERAALHAARAAGIKVTDAEVAQRIFSFPAFQENGQFIGHARYQQFLRMQRPPMSAAEFEDGLRRSLTIEKLRAAVTDWMTITDAEVEREFMHRNEMVKLDLVYFPADKYRPEVEVSDADLQRHFEANKEKYRIGERRKVRYLLVDVEAIRPTIVVPARDVERSYNENIDLYSTPEQVRASHILFKTEGKDEARVRAAAEAVLKQVKAGADFAALAKKHSEDEASAAQGGDLDYFSRGQMVPEFEEVAFSLEPGQTSELVKSPYGFHIIKVADKKPATTRPIEEVRQQIIEQLQWERAQDRASERATALEEEIRRPSDLEKVAVKYGLQVQESGFFTREEPVMAFGASPAITAQVFDLQENQVTSAVPVSRGYAFMTLAGREDPRIPNLDEVKDQVREDILRERTREMARQKAEQLAAEAKTGAALAKAARAAGIEMKTTELVPRGSALPEVGMSPEIDAVAYGLEPGAVTGPIITANGAAIVHVIEKKVPTQAEFAAEKAQLKTTMLEERRNRFFSAYMVKAKQEMRIEVNRQALQQVIG